MSDIQHLGKGARRAPPDKRDFQIAGHPSFAEALAAVNWNTPFILPEPPNEDQNGSSSCVGQAWSFYHWQLNQKNYSRRDLYSRIFLPGGGAYIRDGGLQIVKLGQATRNEVPDPSPETEIAMENKTGATPAAEASDRELDSFTVYLDIDAWAAAIQAYKGIVGGLEGSDIGWHNLAEPWPPLPLQPLWGHALYFFGYHMHNGQKCVIAKSSWGTAGSTTVHHIKSNYFDSAHMFDAWTLIPRSIMQNQTKLVLGKDGKTVYKATPVATDFENLKKQASVEGIEVPNPIPPAASL